MRIVSISTLLVLLISGMLTSRITEASTLVLGTIQYPSTLKALISPTRIYCNGKIASCSVDQQNKNISFFLPRYDSQYSFKLLIVDPRSIEWKNYQSKYQTEATNTISYRKLKEGDPYKLYTLLLVPEISSGEGKHIKYSWRIRQELLHDKEQRIPDDAIVLHTDPHWISHLDGSKGLEFTVYMKKNVIELAGSEVEFRQKMNEIWAATLDSDTVHAPETQLAMKQVNNRIIIAAPLHHAA